MLDFGDVPRCQVAIESSGYLKHGLHRFDVCRVPAEMSWSKGEASLNRKVMSFIWKRSSATGFD